MGTQKKRFNTLLYFIIINLAGLSILIGCGNNTADLPIESAEIVAVPPTPSSTPTAIPESSSNDDSNTVLSGIFDGNEGTVDTIDGHTVTPQPSITPIAQFEPVEVAINLQRGELSPWLELVPPPGWHISQGIDGYLVSNDPAGVPNTPFVLIRRWGNVVNVGDWVAYFPDGQEEPNSTVRIGLAGFEWEGVFITNPNNNYRAFFAVNNDSLPSYTILMYVPAPGGADLSREEMTAVWDRDASSLNAILRRIIFS